MIQADNVELALVGCRSDTPADKIGLGLTTVRLLVMARPVDLTLTRRQAPTHTGYIAGTADGIVSISGQPAKRMILVMDALSQTHDWVAKVWSLESGHYYVPELDPSKRYLVMCRDLPPDGTSQRFEPAVWDYVEPATDLTVAEQQELWESWQTM